MGRIRPRCGYWIRTGSELAEQLAQDVTQYSSVVLFTSSLVLKTLARWPCVRQLALGFPETLSDKFALLPVVDEEFGVCLCVCECVVGGGGGGGREREQGVQI